MDLLDVFVTATATSVGVYLATHVIDKRSEKRQSRQKHQEKIVDLVIEPLIKRLKSYCIPIASLSISPIEVAHLRTEPVDSSKSDWQTKIIPLRKEPTWTVRGEETRDASFGLLDISLYAHTKQWHLSMLLSRLEQTESRLSKWQNELASDALDRSSRISKVSGLPVMETSKMDGSLSIHIGQWVLDRQLGLNPSRLAIYQQSPQHDWFAISADSRHYGEGSEKQIQSLEKIIVEEINNPYGIDMLKTEAVELRAEFESILKKLNEFRESTRPMGRCDLTL